MAVLAIIQLKPEDGAFTTKVPTGKVPTGKDTTYQLDYASGKVWPVNYRKLTPFASLFVLTFDVYLTEKATTKFIAVKKKLMRAESKPTLLSTRCTE